MQNFADWWKRFWRRSKDEASTRPNGAERILDGSQAPEVKRLHATLDQIEAETRLAAKVTQRIDDRRVVARTRRKDLERRGAKLLPDADIDPEDTGEINLVVPV